MKTASFDVDSQNTFTELCPDELPAAGGSGIVDELNLQATLADFRIGSKDTHSAQAIWVADDNHPAFSEIDGPNVDVYWPQHAVLGTKGFELIAGLPAVTEYDYFVWKGCELDMHPYSSCYHDFAQRLSTGVIEFLRDRGVATVIVGGLVTDYCIKSTALHLAAAGFKVIVNLGACRAIAADTEAQALIEMQAAGVSLIQSAQELK